MNVYLIRHGETKGNREHRYVGKTDEGILRDAADQLRKLRLPKVRSVYISPMKRCRETAGILYPQIRPAVVEELKECDFGEFEYENYEELNGRPGYQRFLDTMGKRGFPGGESRDGFQVRCIRGFQKVLSLERSKSRGISDEKNDSKKGFQDAETAGCSDFALVVHGGTIMALLDYYSCPHRDYYDWQVKNGCGYAAELSAGNCRKFSLCNIRPIGLKGEEA